MRIPVRMASPAISYGTRKQLQLYGTSGGTGAGTGGASRSPANDDTGSPKTTTTNNNNKISNSTNNPSTSNRKVVALRIPVRRASPMNGNRKVNNSTTRVTSSVIVASSLSSSSSSPLRGGGVCINNTDQSAREPHVGGLQGQGDITTSSVDSGLSTTATTTTTPNRVVKVVLRRTNSFNLSNESIVLGNATVHPDAMGIITMDSIDKTPTKLMGGAVAEVAPVVSEQPHHPQSLFPRVPSNPPSKVVVVVPAHLNSVSSRYHGVVHRSNPCFDRPPSKPPIGTVPMYPSRRKKLMAVVMMRRRICHSFVGIHNIN